MTDRDRALHAFPDGVLPLPSRFALESVRYVIVCPGKLPIGSQGVAVVAGSVTL